MRSTSESDRNWTLLLRSCKLTSVWLILLYISALSVQDEGWTDKNIFLNCLALLGVFWGVYGFCLACSAFRDSRSAHYQGKGWWRRQNGRHRLPKL